MITRSYGGHYFSPYQAAILDMYLSWLPESPSERSVALATLIWTASRCAAAPGHTAQPFQPTDTALRYIEISWKVDPTAILKSALKYIGPLHANKAGSAIVGDATEYATRAKSTDLVVVDPMRR